MKIQQQAQLPMLNDPDVELKAIFPDFDPSRGYKPPEKEEEEDEEEEDEEEEEETRKNGPKQNQFVIFILMILK